MMPKTIVLMRHAEKPADQADPNLSPAGKERAKHLATWLPQQYPDIGFVFAAAISKESARPYETVEPFAKKAGLPIDDSIADKDYAKLANKLATDTRYQGACVLVCWHHGEIPQLAAALGAPAGSYPDPWPSDVFNLVLQMDYNGGSVPKMKQITEPF
jgi:phosphohistidine phosphatase SixA